MYALGLLIIIILNSTKFKNTYIDKMVPQQRLDSSVTHF